MSEAPRTPQERAAKFADIARLMEANDSMKNVYSAVESFASNATRLSRARRPKDSDRLMAIAREEAKRLFTENMESLVTRFTGIYDRYFTHSEILAMLAFYESPIGKKVLRVMPEIMPASIESMQAWAHGLTPALRERIRARDGEFPLTDEG